MDEMDEVEDSPELISKMTYRGVEINVIESDSPEVTVTKHVFDEGYTVTIPKDQLMKLAQRNLVAVFVNTTIQGVMLLINNDLDATE